MSNDSFIALFTSVTAIAAFATQFAGISREQWESGKAKTIRFLGFVSLLACLGAIYLNWSSSRKAEAAQLAASRKDAERHIEVTDNQKRVEPKVDDIWEKTTHSNARVKRLEDIEELDRAHLRSTYPFGYKVFGTQGGQVVEMPFLSEKLGDERIELFGDFQDSQIFEVKGHTAFSFYSASWKRHLDDGIRFGRFDGGGHLKLKRGAILEHLELEKSYPWTVEVLDASKDAPVFVLGFRQLPTADDEFGG